MARMNAQPTTFTLSDDELVALCQDSAWQIIRFDRIAQGYRVEAVKVESNMSDSTPERREPYRDD